MDTLKARGLNLRGIGWFLGLAFGIAWLADLPMILDGQGLHSPWAPLIYLRDFAPAIATLIVTRWISPLPHTRVATGVRWGVRGTRWGWYWLFGCLAIPLLVYVVAPLVGGLLGVMPLDLAHFSGYQAYVTGPDWPGPAVGAGANIARLAIIMLLALPVMTLLMTPLAFGEEWGWRGYLLPHLLPLGQWPAFLAVGVIWGLWHIPVPLTSAYPGVSPLLAVGLFVGMTTLLSVVLGWMRLATGSVWPAAVAHAGVDAGERVGLFFVFTQAGVTYDAATMGFTGWSGLLAGVLLVGVLVLLRRVPVRALPPDTLPADSPAPARPIAPTPAPRPVG